MKLLRKIELENKSIEKKGKREKFAVWRRRKESEKLILEKSLYKKEKLLVATCFAVWKSFKKKLKKKMTTNLQQGTLLDVLKKKMRQTKEEMERFKDECEDYNRKLQLEVMRREEVS